MDVFAWHPSDMIGVPRRLIKHALNVNNSVSPIAQKRRVLERALPFFEMLKNITKENKEDYRWTEEAEHALQELKKLILELPTLTGEQKETLFVYLATSCDAVSGVLVADRKGKQTPIRYVSRTLHEAERNYDPLEKLALCLLHISQRLRRYFEAHLIKVITDQPVKQILNKPEASGKIAKYFVELGAYNITYIPRTAVKGQILADFINEVPVGTRHVEVCSLAREGDPKGWTLYMDGASSLKGVRVGLVLIDPFSTEYTYAIWLTFPSTHNEAEYEELLAGLRLARKIKVSYGERRSPIQKVISLSNVKMCRPVTSNYIIREVHEGARGMHAGAKFVVAKIMKQGYYWPTMHEDTKEVVDKCDSYQIHASVPKLPKTRLTSIMSLWPFYQWSLDILGPLLKGLGKLKFIIVAIDYFTKWIEAKPLVKPQIKQMNTVVAHPQANGLVERANKSLMHGLKARLGRERVGWVDELPNIMWAYCMMLKTSNGKTPFSLTYGSEAVILAEIEMPTYRTIHFNEAQNKEEMRLNLDLSQERRETTAIREAKYKKMVEQYYNKRVRQFKVGDFVYQKKPGKVGSELGRTIPGN
nr:reverse transcriptase domain-containing protein [Tanacetum cinerariifolium]